MTKEEILKSLNDLSKKAVQEMQELSGSIAVSREAEISGDAHGAELTFTIKAIVQGEKF